MIGALEFIRGLSRIGIALRQPADDATMEVYHDSLAKECDEPEWDAFCNWAVDTSRWQWFPKVSEIRAGLRAFRGERPVEAEAMEAYERVLAAGRYAPEGGTTWSYRAVREACGCAAADAFLIAGGPSAFATTWDEAKRRERFVAAYVIEVLEEPDTALLPAAPAQKALPAGDAAPGAPLMSPEEVLGRLQRMTGASAPRAGGYVVTASDERLAELRKQAAQALGQEG